VIWKITSAGAISVAAGTLNSCGFSGDNGSATGAQLNNPSGVAVDGFDSDFYISDSANNRIRMVDVHSGQITTVSGDGMCAFSGDGGPAINAEVCAPTGMVVYKRAVYFGDTGNYRLRQIDKLGNMSTLAGTGIPGYNGDQLLFNQTNLDYPYSVTNFKMSGDVIYSDLVQARVRQIHN
jgi:serine/threonine-protein kinase